MFLQASCNERLHDGRFIAPPPQGRMLNTPLQSIRREQDQCFDTCFLLVQGNAPRTPQPATSAYMSENSQQAAPPQGPPPPQSAPPPNHPPPQGPFQASAPMPNYPPPQNQGWHGAQPQQAWGGQPQPYYGGPPNMPNMQQYGAPPYGNMGGRGGGYGRGRY